MQASPQKRQRDTQVDQQLLSLARAAGVVFDDHELFTLLVGLLRIGVAPKNIAAVLEAVAEARERARK
ncbi:hypothetical protein DFJ74DRAFT_703204 [Hyaloraphidium curvatum]|nr:hypothetical protein DFJ74DRAFT_703204 [Hyaloraphidium curvatum]